MTSSIALADSARLLPGIGPRRGRLFGRLLGIEGDPTLGELLTIYPREHEDRRRLTAIRDLRPGVTATFYAQVSGAASDRRTPSGKSLTQAPVSDGTGVVLLGWFNQPYIKKKIQVGDRYIVTGKVERFATETRVIQPDIEQLAGGDALSGGRIVPIYPLTEGLQQPVVRQALRQALDVGVPLLSEIMPESIRRRRRLMGAREAAENIHFPSSPEALEGARRRLKFEELLLVQVLLALRKARAQERPGIRLVIDEPIAAEIRRMTPFSPTGAQKRVVREIFRDLVKPVPMNRLLQGDVGSGKTIVAAIAVVAVVRNHCQAAIMAPTEILAEQHYATFRQLLEPLGIPVRLLTGSLSARGRGAVLEDLAAGNLPVVVGTHALIQEGVTFQRLGLAVVDEQHRFGVEQRMRIRHLGESGEDPHVLVMTATPIPRTLSLTAYGHLDISLLDELPPGRTPIRTEWAPYEERHRVYGFLKEQAAAGRQAYVVCPLIDDSDRVPYVSACGWFDYLHDRVLPGVPIGLLHGRMRSEEKDRVMTQFRQGEVQVLAATSVIEVGVDVPNATVMVIEDASAFGLAQLHQLRGRVGRGTHSSHCFLVTDERYNPYRAGNGRLIDTGEDEVDVGQRRMRILVESSDGFRIAEEDFQIRGVGIYFGTAQHGRSRLRIADLHRDLALVQEARDEAFALVQADPRLENPEHAGIRDRLADMDLIYEIEEDYSAVA